jgi:hypothetical protein
VVGIEEVVRAIEIRGNGCCKYAPAANVGSGYSSGD